MLATATICGLWPSRARAEPRTDRDRLWHALPVVLGEGLDLALGLGLADALGGTGCRWCGGNAVDDRVRAAVRWDDGGGADVASSITAYVAIPALATGLLVATTADRPRLRRWFDDVIPVAQAGVATTLLTQGLKLVVRRQRPWAGNDAEPPSSATDRDRSFPSGHTAVAFALAISTATVATLRGYRSAPAIWAIGAGLAVATGYLRIAADAHYLTDVAAGAVLGAGLGLLVPWALHRDVLAAHDDARWHLSLAPVAGTVGVAVRATQ
ncbi:MAG: phosphatase PAP2 family protein [Kofleriaceae bacterium]